MGRTGANAAADAVVAAGFAAPDDQCSELEASGNCVE